jgi:hypothetical protein
MPAPSQNMAESANAKPKTIAFWGKIVVCRRTPCTSSAINNRARPIPLMPDAFDARALGTGAPAGMPASAGPMAVWRCARQPATARPP